MVLGRLNQERKNLQSTKIGTKITKMESENECYFPQHEKEKCNMMFSTIHCHTPKHTAYRDLKG